MIQHITLSKRMSFVALYQRFSNEQLDCAVLSYLLVIFYLRSPTLACSETPSLPAVCAAAPRPGRAVYSPI